MLAQGYNHIVTPRERAAAAELLREAGLDMPEGIDTGLGFYEDGRLVGVAFLAGNVICGVCTSSTHQEQGLASSLVGRILTEALGKGFGRVCIFTKPEEAPKFAVMGFHLVAATEAAALLEFGSPDYAAWMRQTRAELAQGENVPLGAVVMNANPFTLGHRGLVEEAVRRCPQVVVFVVEEDASAFPFADRLALVRHGVSGIAGAAVLPAGPYMVSRGSFPAYFSGKAAHAAVHAGLDAEIFAAKVAPDLGIAIRFVGDEPYCPATATYNAVMRRVLPAHGIGFCEMPRRCGGEGIISASKVREILRDERYGQRTEELRQLVPETTLEFLLSDKGRGIAEALRGRSGRH
ncbi:GNAT family N-acetyltransferase [Oleispirillum naphthae]|uniref:GNAT family N-acetyltransferase n=1 Tax=Oleispirillum naphthae TaxID=2838853 RepID=UPI00308224E5